MNKFIIMVVIAGTTLLLSACSDAVSSPGNEQFLKAGSSQDLIGTWVHKGFENDTLWVMHKSDGLDENQYGFIFHTNGKFIERKNAGWCGTPPIVYANFDGTWEAESDSVISISVGFWGGISEYKINIITLTDSELKYIPVYY